MDVSIFVESWREGIKYSMPKEPLFKKACVAGGGLLTLVFCLTLAVYQMRFWNNVLVIQHNFNNTKIYNNTYWENSTYYDIQYYNGTYENETLAAQLKTTLNTTCDWPC